MSTKFSETEEFVVTDDGFHLSLAVDFTVPRTEGAVNVDNPKPCLHFYSAHLVQFR